MTDSGVVIAGRYRLADRAGEGAMGAVWRATDERLGRVVAVKQLGTDDPRAMREARVAARLRHPHAVTVHDVVDSPEGTYLVMEYVPLSLATLLRGGRRPAVAQVARIGAQVASALAAAHELGIVHRDVTPGNILLGPGQTAKIADFGISRAPGEEMVTAAGFIAGTPAYLAPEVAAGGQATPASDVFSLGATLYTAMEGKPPYGKEPTTLAMLMRIVEGELEPPRRSGPLTGILLHMLRRDPGERPTMAQVHAELSPPRPRPVALPVLSPVAASGAGDPWQPARRPRWRVAVVLGLAAAGLAGGGVLAGYATSGGGAVTGSAELVAAPSACEARLEVTNSWPGGYQARVVVRNVHPAAIDGWAVHWAQPAGHALNDLWNGRLDQRGDEITVTGGVLGAGSSTDFGLIAGVHSDNPVLPAVTCQA
ncbi:serine/threonine-protein kinase [Amycolatopsis sp. 195334CR]|uniref:serine/threonine-protein kinase n=1 Tax=Amycolatopsis sp. 195334CR TaxID=2814588 RepID=UPI001A8EA2F1|nr:serine/threonine-protein kinase [Amycolatopsis sp. 195334CR]MBN6039489.1 protein kinase [Amycolatopsis sp. 195334CR]